MPKKSTNVLGYPASNYMFKVNNVDITTTCETCSKLTVKVLLNWRRSSVFIVNFEYISLLNFKQVNTGYRGTS